MTDTFTTFANVFTANQVNLQVGKIYKVKFAGKKVRATFQGAEEIEVLVRNRSGSHLRQGKVALNWKPVTTE